MTKAQYASLIKPYIYDYLEKLKNDDFEGFFTDIKTTYGDKKAAQVYQFFVEELNADPINYMTVIPEKFFSDIPIISLVVPANITSIEDGAFMNNTSIEKIIFNTTNLNEIPAKCFEGCSNLNSIDFSKVTCKLNFVPGSLDGINSECKIWVSLKQAKEGLIGLAPSDVESARHKFKIIDRPAVTSEATSTSTSEA